MAGTDLVIPSAAKGISLLKSTLSLIQEKKQEHNLPAPFSTYKVVPPSYKLSYK